MSTPRSLHVQSARFERCPYRRAFNASPASDPTRMDGSDAPTAATTRFRSPETRRRARRVGPDPARGRRKDGVRNREGAAKSRSRRSRNRRARRSAGGGGEEKRNRPPRARRRSSLSAPNRKKKGKPRRARSAGGDGAGPAAGRVAPPAIRGAHPVGPAPDSSDSIRAFSQRAEHSLNPSQRAQ